ncbi:hypothetical protein LSAT2_028961 [Lamellibrachia satsuma]|nr:hypothetical protein LSAT2_028961 [Lamellibrachia satsuma]
MLFKRSECRPRADNTSTRRPGFRAQVAPGTAKQRRFMARRIVTTIGAWDGERQTDGCYGGYLLLDCDGDGDRRHIHVIRETYGRHPQDKCRPSPDKTDCAIKGNFYRNLCEGNVTCRHLGVPWILIDTPECPAVYTNYVRIIYRCLDNGVTGT